MLRAAVAAETEVGKMAKDFMDSGKLVPDEVIIGIVSIQDESYNKQQSLFVYRVCIFLFCTPEKPTYNALSLNHSLTHSSSFVSNTFINAGQGSLGGRGL